MFEKLFGSALHRKHIVQLVVRRLNHSQTDNFGAVSLSFPTVFVSDVPKLLSPTLSFPGPPMETAIKPNLSKGNNPNQLRTPMTSTASHFAPLPASKWTPQWLLFPGVKHHLLPLLPTKCPHPVSNLAISRYGAMSS